MTTVALARDEQRQFLERRELLEEPLREGEHIGGDLVLVALIHVLKQGHNAA